MTARIIAVLMGVTVVVLVALTVPLAVSFENQRRTALSTTLERDALRLGDVAEDRLEGADHRDLAPLVESYREQTGGRVVIVDARGVAVADSDPPASTGGSLDRSFASRPEIEAALAGETVQLERRSDTLDDTLFVVAAPVRSGDEILGAVRVTESTSEIDEEILRYRLALLAISAVALGLAALLGALTGRWATRPIRQLQRAAATLGEGDLGARADAEHGPPEVRDLARRFNAMADRVGRLVRSSQEFAADASHQLRTPLTAIRLRLDSLREETPGGGSADLVDALGADVDRLQRTVDGLLALTRVDQAAVHPEEIDLRALVDARAVAWAPAAEDASVELRNDVPEGTTARFDPNHLEQVLDNLIANALDFAPAGTAVTLSAVGTGDVVELRVVDHGPGIPADRRALALERGWHGRSGGTGLGLAISARLCQHNDATLRLDETPGGGLDATLRIASCVLP